MTTNQTERVPDEELDQMIWKLERDGMTPKQLSMMRELREVRRAKGEPVACIFKHPAGKLFWAITDESNKGQSDVIPVYIDPPAPVVPDALADSIDSDDHPLLWSYNNGWNACRAAMLQTDGTLTNEGTMQLSGNAEQLEPVSNRDELPLDYLQGHKDGLAWAAQLAEANHPQTGDWLYDDPIELAKAIRKGPDMPLASGNSPATPDGWIAVSERLPGREYVIAADISGAYYPPHLPNTQVGIYADWFEDGNPSWDDGDGNDLHLKQVTHWMPIPKPPKDDL